MSGLRRPLLATATIMTNISLQTSRAAALGNAASQHSCVVMVRFGPVAVLSRNGRRLLYLPIYHNDVGLSSPSQMVHQLC